MIKTDSIAPPREVKGTNTHNVRDVAKRAAEELSYANIALQRAGAIFEAIEKATGGGGGIDLAFLLAQTGIETTGYQAERAESECDFFLGVASHG